MPNWRAITTRVTGLLGGRYSLCNGPGVIVIEAAPDLVHHSGDTFTIETPDAPDIRRVVFVRPMAVTHQTDSEQRVIQMPFTRSATRLVVTVPDPDHPHGTAPRGYYMLFILNGEGVPSEGSFIFLH